MTDADRIRTALRTIRATWQLSIDPGKAPQQEGGTAGKAESRPPVTIGGVSLRAEVASVLAQWCLLVITERGLPGGVRDDDLDGMCDWLDPHVDWLAEDDQATGRDGRYLADELEGLADRLRAMAAPGLPHIDNVIGTCPICKVGELAKFGTLIRCDKCAEKGEAWEWWEWRFPEHQRDVTQAEIAEEYGVSEAVVWQWVKRKGFIPLNPGGRPVLYRWAQVRWAVEYRPAKTACPA